MKGVLPGHVTPVAFTQGPCSPQSKVQPSLTHSATRAALMAPEHKELLLTSETLPDLDPLSQVHG